MERNIFSGQKSTFCLLQQITLENDKKYFIFGIKFNDIFIPEQGQLQIKDNLAKLETKVFENISYNVFIYEKTYLFISKEPLCKLFESMFKFIINYKKLIFCRNIDDFESLKDINKVKKFNDLNKENVNINILFIKNLIFIK